MEVTRSNFHDLLPEIENAITESDFVSIDCEFTGLNNGQEPKGYDSPAQYYVKLKDGSLHFIIIQFGLCTFKYERISDSYQTRCYNFYIFPLCIQYRSNDVRFMCQASSLSFLISNGLDFNKVIGEGIPYLTKKDETYFRSKLQERQEKRLSEENKHENTTLMKISEEDQEQIDRISEEISNFINTASGDDQLTLGPFNSYIRRILYSNVLVKFRDKVVFQSVANKNGARAHGSIVVLLKGDKECDRKREEQRQMQEENEMQEAVGFSYVIRKISESGKLVVGHNMFLDLMHIINQFICELPTNYYTFKDIANCCFTHVIDTKYLASCPIFKEMSKNTVLLNLLEILKNEPFGLPKIEIASGAKGYSISDEKCHEAAFDAFLTGICFMSMAEYIAKVKKVENVISKDSPFLQKYMNKIYNFRLIDIPFLNLNGKDPEPRRDNILYLSFPKEWKQSNIVELFSPFGDVHIIFITETSAYVALLNHNQVRFALKKLSKSDTYEMMSYVKYQALVNAARPLPSKSDNTKKRKISELAKGCMSRIFGQTDDDDDDDGTNVEIKMDSSAAVDATTPNEPQKTFGNYVVSVFFSVLFDYTLWKCFAVTIAIALKVYGYLDTEILAYIFTVICLIDVFNLVVVPVFSEM